MIEHVNQHLQQFCGATPDVLGCAVIDIEGMITASALSRNVDEDLIGGISSTMLGVGERISSELMDADLEQVYVRSPNGYVMINSIGEQSLLLVLAKKQAKLGLVFLEMQRTIQDLEKLI